MPDMHGIDGLLDLIKAAGKKANLEKGRTLELNIRARVVRKEPWLGAHVRR